MSHPGAEQLQSQNLTKLADNTKNRSILERQLEGEIQIHRFAKEMCEFFTTGLMKFLTVGSLSAWILLLSVSFLGFSTGFLPLLIGILGGLFATSAIGLRILQKEFRRRKKATRQYLQELELEGDIRFSLAQFLSDQQSKVNDLSFRRKQLREFLTSPHFYSNPYHTMDMELLEIVDIIKNHAKDYNQIYRLIDQHYGFDVLDDYMKHETETLQAILNSDFTVSKPVEKGFSKRLGTYPGISKRGNHGI